MNGFAAAESWATDAHKWPAPGSDPEVERCDPDGIARLIRNFIE